MALKYSDWARLVSMTAAMCACSLAENTSDTQASRANIVLDAAVCSQGHSGVRSVSERQLDKLVYFRDDPRLT